MAKLDGIITKAPKQGAPSYVKGTVSIKVEAFIKSLKEHESNGWVNFNIKESKAGELYLEHDDWKPGSRNTDPAP